MKVETQDPLELLKMGDEKFLESLYREHEAKFIHWIARQYSISREEATDVFQNAIITCYQNAVSGKLSALNSHLGTYLFAIGSNLTKALLREKAKQPMSLEELRSLDIPDETIAITVHNEKILLLLEVAGEKCKKLLITAVHSTMKSEVLAGALGYPSAEMYRKKKHECLRKLQEFVEKKQLTIQAFLV